MQCSLSTLGSFACPGLILHSSRIVTRPVFRGFLSHGSPECVVCVLWLSAHGDGTECDPAATGISSAANHNPGAQAKRFLGPDT